MTVEPLLWRIILKGGEDSKILDDFQIVFFNHIDFNASFSSCLLILERGCYTELGRSLGSFIVFRQGMILNNELM